MKERTIKDFLEADIKRQSYDVEGAALPLLVIFQMFCIKNKDGAYLVSDQGLEEMSDWFGGIPKEERGHVFLEFLCMLYDHEYIYDVRQFLGMEEVENEKT